MRTNKNLIEANNELDSASKLQKKFKRKYFLCALMIIILVLAVLGVVFFGNVVWECIDVIKTHRNLIYFKYLFPIYI